MECGNEVAPWYRSVKNGSGCKFCVPYGFDLKLPAIVYLLKSPDFQALKVGVTSIDSADRVKRHVANGWVKVETWDVATGEDAVRVEQSILGWWRNDLGAPEVCTAADMPQGGWTETAPLLFVDLDETVARIQVEVDRLTKDMRESTPGELDQH